MGRADMGRPNLQRSRGSSEKRRGAGDEKGRFGWLRRGVRSRQEEAPQKYGELLKAETLLDARKQAAGRGKQVAGRFAGLELLESDGGMGGRGYNLLGW